MALILEQATEVIIPVGAFVDAVDAVTPETSIALADADQAELLGPAGAATVDIKGNTWAAITGCGGWYHLTLTAANLTECGAYMVVVQDADVCLAVKTSLFVIDSSVYDFWTSNKSLQSYLAV